MTLCQRDLERLQQDTITAVGFHAPGAPEVLRQVQVARPHAKAGQVVVSVRATSINHLDLWVRGGLPHLKLEMPHILGSDAAGVVVEVGEDVTGIEVGSPCLVAPATGCGHCRQCLSGQDNLCRHYRIFGENCPGVQAELVALPAANILPFPKGLSWAEAASIPLTFLTAWQMLVLKAKVKPGETVLIQAGASGVGSAGIQIAKLFGATVISTASTEEKLALATSLGADHVINYKEESFRKACKALTQGRGVDIIFEHVGQTVWGECLRTMASGGRLVTCGATSGFAAETDLRHVFFRQLQIMGSTMGPKGSLYDILEHFESGALRPVVDRAFPFSEAVAAHEHVAARKSLGKTLLVPDDIDGDERP